MKKLFCILLTVALVAAFAFMLVACDNNKTETFTMTENDLVTLRDALSATSNEAYFTNNTRIENAITASETGHLVIGTLHTSDAANTLNRLLDVFPPSQQPQIRAMTAGSLRGIICQRLLPAENGGLTIAYEILINNMAVANIINEGKAFKLKSTMQIGNKQGMCTLDQCLLGKYKAGLISYEVAKYYMHDQAELTQLEREFAIRQARQLQGN